VKSEHRQMVAYLYQIPGFSPLEIAAELGLTFRQVCAEIDRRCLRKIDIAVAKGLRKATRADSFLAEDSGFTNPFAR
jgi:hypothetical protein